MTEVKLSVRFRQISASRRFAPRLVLAMRSGLPYVIVWFGIWLGGRLIIANNVYKTFCVRNIYLYHVHYDIVHVCNCPLRLSSVL